MFPWHRPILATFLVVVAFIFASAAPGFALVILFFWLLCRPRPTPARRRR